MVNLVYVDETGSVGKGARRQPLLTLAAVVVPEEAVRPLSEAVREVTTQHLGYYPAGFELHGHEIWAGSGPWSGHDPTALLRAYEAAVRILPALGIDVAWSSIHKERLKERYSGRLDEKAYLLALQFLLEKLDTNVAGLKVVIADEHKEQELGAIKMVADMQEWGGGAVPGRTLTSFIDSMHFVSSHDSPGVQMADLVAYALQRRWSGTDRHPDAVAGLARIQEVIMEQARTWRETWPPEPWIKATP